MKLTDCQTLLQNSILTEKSLIHPYLCDPPKGAISDRVAIYVNGFYSRLEEALRSDYDTLASFVGANEFGLMCRQYIEAYPSNSYSLNFLGHKLSQFLIETSPYDKAPYLAEMASFQWAEAQAIIASDAPLLSVADLQSLPPSQWPDITFYLHPSSTLLTMHWNGLSLIKALRHNGRILSPKKLKKPQAVLVWRRQQDVRYCLLDRQALLVIEAMRSQASFGEICERLRPELPENEIAQYLVQQLHVWLQEQLLTRPSSA